jgi:riboflavin-specific deaminase-like protein
MRSPADDFAPDIAWAGVQAAARDAERLERAGAAAAFAIDAHGSLQPIADNDPNAAIRWRPGSGWQSLLRSNDPRQPIVELYLPICGATARRPITVGHLGQSLDGFIATHSGDSRWVTGEENIVHMHRLRALSDAVVVGAGTIAADDPQLTTRLVSGPNPLRVVLDPARRLPDHHRVFNDASAETIYICAQSLMRTGERTFGRARMIGVADSPDGGVDALGVMRLLRSRGCRRVFVEGGGVTVSMFLAANLLDRLHVTIAPLIIGDGRPAIRLTPRAALGDCHRPRYRVFRMGGDVLFDCDLTAEDDGAGSSGNRRRQSLASSEPRGQIIVTDDDVRTIRVDVRETARLPVENSGRFVRRDFDGCLDPSFDQPSLQLTDPRRGRRQHPVASLSYDVISARFERALGAIGRVGTSRASESFVVLSLMLVEQLANQIIFRLGG